MNESKTKNTNSAIKYISIVIVLIFAILSIVLYCKVGIVDMTLEAAACVAISISGLLLTAALFILTTGDHREITKSDKTFLVTLVALSFSLFFSESGWFMEGRPQYKTVYYIVETVSAISNCLMIVLFYQYLLATVLVDKMQKLKPLTIIIMVITGIECLIALTNPFTGLMFIIDEAGCQVEGPFMFLVLGEVSYAFWLLAFVWVFIAIYDGNRRKLDSKKHDIEVADSVFKSIIPKEDEDMMFTPEMQALIDSHTIPDAMKLSEIITRERVRRMMLMQRSQIGGEND